MFVYNFITIACHLEINKFNYSLSGTLKCCSQKLFVPKMANNADLFFTLWSMLKTLL